VAIETSIFDYFDYFGRAWRADRPAPDPRRKAGRMIERPLTRPQEASGA
jgi:hypothetical protein